MVHCPAMGLSCFLFVGFAIKLPMVPFHTWLPDAHVEAPTPISVILAALLLKIGGYGLVRIAFPIFPDSAVYFGWFVGLMGVISILYGGLNAMASKDLKRLIAYSSVSHMGFVLLGIASLTPEGVAGSVYQMFSHGIISAMLFLLAGVIYDRTSDRMIGELFRFVYQNACLHGLRSGGFLCFDGTSRVSPDSLLKSWSFSVRLNPTASTDPCTKVWPLLQRLGYSLEQPTTYGHCNVCSLVPLI